MTREMRKFKLLLDLTALDTPSRQRGIGRYIRELALGLRSLARDELDDVEVLGLTSFGWTGRFSVTHDVGSFEGDPRIASPTELDSIRWNWRLRMALWRTLRSVGADAIHLPDPHATPWFQSSTGTKKIVTCHDLIPLRFPDRYSSFKDGGAWGAKKIESRRYRSADLVVAISEATRDDLIQLAHVSPEKIVVVPNGVDIARWSRPSPPDAKSVLEKHGLSGIRFALYVGGADWRKNPDGMIATLAEAKKEGHDLHLVWAASLSRYYFDIVERLAREAGIGDRLHLIGYVDDDELLILYRASLAHLFLSRCEGFGLTVVEAMAAGCPVVTTNAGALKEVAGDAALTVDADDAAAAAHALERLANDAQLRESVVKKGLARAPTFDRVVQARAMARVYRDFFNALGPRQPHRG